MHIIRTLQEEGGAGVTGEGVSPLLSPSRNEKTKKCLASGTNDCKHELVDAKNLKNKKGDVICRL